MDPERGKEEDVEEVQERDHCLSQRLRLDLIFDTEHVAFECKSILIVPPSAWFTKNL